MVFDGFCQDELWNWTNTWNPPPDTAPDFSLCFEQTILTYAPCLFILLLTPYDVYNSIKSGKQGNCIPWRGSFALAKTILNTGLISLQLQLLAWVLTTDETVYHAQVVQTGLRTLAFILVSCLAHFSRANGVCSSGPQFLFWLLMAALEAFSFRTTILHADTVAMYPFVLEMIFYPLVLVQLVLSCWADKPLDKSHMNRKKGVEGKKPCPEQRASFISKIVFSWFDGLGIKGYRRPLEDKDLWDLNPEDKSDAWYPLFDKDWERSQEKAKRAGSAGAGAKKSKTKPASILPTLVRVFGPSFAFGAFMKVVHDLLIFVQPEILDRLIAHVQDDEESWKGYVYTVLLFASAVVQTLFLGQYFHVNFLIGMRLRSTLVSVIYRKALIMSNSARKESTVGEIVNLMSVDAQRFMDTMPYLNMLWSAPLQMALCLYFLWQTLGPSVLAGLAVMILLVPVNGFIVSKVRALQVAQMKNKDERVKLMSEILSGIKVLKLYAWEPSFQDQIMKIREREIKLLKKSAYLFSFVAFIWTCTPFLVSVVTFATYVLVDRDNVLDARKAFVSTTLFNIMRAPLSMLPLVITGVVQASVSLKRLNKFMNGEEIDPSSITHEPSAKDPIQLQDASFAWDSSAGSDGDGSTPPTPTPNLKNINLHIKEGSLTAIVGAVGSGKSTLLAAILGELEKLSGHVNTRGSIAYVAQVAWIQNDTLRNNVLFGKPFDSAMYDEVIDSCALRPDLQILTAGDQTEIGEKGINLSGGQKQRVALARAAYNDAEIYLLDDPLSAVDSHVGKHIFENVLGPKGLLRGKTRVLVTHGVTFLPQTDRIVVLKDGEISEEGSYEELLARKGAFAEFLVQHLGGEGEGDEQLDSLALDEHTAASALKILRDLQGVGVLGDSEASKLTRQISRQSFTGEKEAGVGAGAGAELTRQISVVSTKAPSLRERKSSKSSMKKSGAVSPSDAAPPKKEKLIEVEKAQTGSVKIGVYVHYMKSISWTLTGLTLGLHVLNQGFQVYANIWLTKWSDESKNASTVEASTQNKYLGVYGALGVGQAVSILFGSLTMALGTLYASSFLHSDMLKRVLKSPMSFFDTTPTGRVVNRFAKDVDTCDNVLPQNLRALLTCFLSVVATIAVISYSTPIFMSVILPTGVIYYLVQRFYVATSRQLKRLESISRSPIYSHFGETLTGTTTIRAYGVQPVFIRASEAKVDTNQTAYFPSIVSNRWLAVRLETVGNLLILFAALFAVMNADDPGLAGLSISYALQITQTLNWLVRMTSDVETNIVAVERIKEYCEIDQEAAWDGNGKPSPNWPASGEVKFEKYATRYREGMDLVLRDVTCEIRPAEKVGIVGRTGAGKSSLTLGLFRIIEAAGGCIKIDGQNIAKLGLHDVRGKITIIPQDPVLFSGTLRLNLDPFDRYSDDALWSALEHAHLKSFVQSVPNGLEYEVNEGGENLSVGQRQLICLARALLRKTKILVLDEATAAIDLETDDLIQQTIRSEFRECTVLTIAHRLNTIMDSTRVMVLDRGEIREFDTPAALLEDKNSIFYGMAKDAGLV